MRTIGTGMARLGALVALAVGMLLSSAEAAAQSRLFYISQTGDWVGQGAVVDLRDGEGWTFSSTGIGTIFRLSLQGSTLGRATRSNSRPREDSRYPPAPTPTWLVSPTRREQE